jgi:hypothetical protein
MPFNIMDLFNQQNNASTIGAVARLLGEDEKKTSAGIAGAIPAVLGGLLGSTSEAEGEQTFSKALDQADPGLARNIRVALGSSGRWAMMKTGSQLLNSLFGDQKFTALSNAIAGYSGLSEESSKSLLGVTAPFIMSNLAKQGQAKGLDGKGMLTLLMSQKDNIAKAIPDDLGMALSGSGLLDSLEGDVQAPAGPVAAKPQAVLETAPLISQPAPKAEPEPEPEPKSEPIPETASEPTPEPTPTPKPKPRTEPEPPQKKRSFLLPLMLLALLVAAAWFGYQYLVQSDSGATSTTSNALENTSDNKAPAVLSDRASPVYDDLSVLLTSTQDAFTVITSEETARNTLPKLEAINSDFADLTTRANGLSAQQRQRVASQVNSKIHTIQALAENALAIPGVEAIIGDVANAITADLKQLSL